MILLIVRHQVRANLTTDPRFAAHTTANAAVVNLSLNPAAVAHKSVQALFDRQSTTLEQAASRYSLKNGRPPPPRYDRWFKFARDRSCLIDDYDQIYRDYKPFYQLAEDDPLFFQRMIDVAWKQVIISGIFARLN
jgi:hypothetical protein